MTHIRIRSVQPTYYRDPEVEAIVELSFPPGHAKAALAALAQAVMDVLVEARKTDGPTP